MLGLHGLVCHQSSGSVTIYMFMAVVTTAAVRAAMRFASMRSTVALLEPPPDRLQLVPVAALLFTLMRHGAQDRAAAAVIEAAMISSGVSAGEFVLRLNKLFPLSAS